MSDDQHGKLVFIVHKFIHRRIVHVTKFTDPLPSFYSSVQPQLDFYFQVPRRTALSPQPAIQRRMQLSMGIVTGIMSGFCRLHPVSFLNTPHYQVHPEVQGSEYLCTVEDSTALTLSIRSRRQPDILNLPYTIVVWEFDKF